VTDRRSANDERTDDADEPLVRREQADPDADA
jgi:hypothetical protein